MTKSLNTLLALSVLMMGCEKDRIKDTIVSSYNCSERIAEFIIPYQEIHEDTLQLYLASVFPQYRNGVIEKHEKFAYVTLFDRITINKWNLKQYYNPNDSLITVRNNQTTYSVVYNPFSLKTADGHN